MDAFKKRFPEAKLITWLRHPVSRTVSLYNHIMVQPDMNNPIIMKIYDSRLSILEFSQVSWIRNHAFNYLKQSTPKDFHFIGFLDDYTASLERCAQTLGWTTVPPPVWENRNVDPPRPSLSSEEEDVILSQNREEFDWYLKARKHFL